MSERHFRRLPESYEEGGAAALVDRRRGRPAANRAPETVADGVEDQFGDGRRYCGRADPPDEYVEADFRQPGAMKKPAKRSAIKKSPARKPAPARKR